MGTYVHASIAYGFTVEAPGWDIDADYDENAPEPDVFDGWEMVRDIPGIDCDSTADSQWDESAQFIYVESTKVTVSEDAITTLDPDALHDPDVAARANLDAAKDRVPSHMRYGQPGWHLYWSRG